jgi:UMF1 family MFS transporter
MTVAAARTTVVRPADRRSVVAWCFYDWANSAFATVIQTFLFSAYFAGAVVGDPERGQVLWGHVNSVAAFVIAVVSPVIGAIADQGGRRKPWLLALSVLGIAATAALWFVRPNPADVAFALVAFGIATIGFELGTTFYNAMLPDLVRPDRLGRVSGWGWGLGYAGGLVCLAVSLLIFIQPDPSPLGLDREAAQHVRAVALMVAAWFGLFAVPLFLFVPDRPPRGRAVAQIVRLGLIDLAEKVRHVRRYANIARFLAAKMIYMDGLNTLFTFGGIYAAGIFGMSLEELLVFGILLNVTAGGGAVLFAWVDDRVGAKPTILMALGALTVLSSAVLLVESKWWFYALAMGIGVFLGPVQAASRSLMARLAPPLRRTEFFGLYTLAGRATAFLGPFLVGWGTLAFESQRAGMWTIVPFFVLGGLLLLWVKEPRR